MEVLWSWDAVCRIWQTSSLISHPHLTSTQHVHTSCAHLLSTPLMHTRCSHLSHQAEVQHALRVQSHSHFAHLVRPLDDRAWGEKECEKEVCMGGVHGRCE